MIRMNIDGKDVDVPRGSTVLEAARLAGAVIPALCDLPGYPAHTSCMVCLVRDCASGRMLPSCSVSAEAGMAIDTGGSDVIELRRGALEFLLTEHVGACEGPCRPGCPAHMDIPLMIRQIAAGDFESAILTVKNHIALPAVLGRICPAPCEKVCRRRECDEALSICRLKRFVADQDLAASSPACPSLSAESGRRVAIVGAGPTGLAAAYYLQRQGHACTVLDEHERAGGMLRYGVPEASLPRDVLAAEIASIEALGVCFRLNTRIDSSDAIGRLGSEFDAVVLAVGESVVGQAGQLGVAASDRGITVDGRRFTTSRERVFAGGAAVAPMRMAVRAVAHGREMAAAVSQALAGEPVSGEVVRFNSRIGRLDEEEMRCFSEGVRTGGRVATAAGDADGFAPDEARREAERCLHCDCRARSDCLLRTCAEQVEARQIRGRDNERPPFRRLVQPAGVIFEPGKCIRCGRCVRITEKAQEPLGLAFIGRGFDIRVAVPFDGSLEDALRTTAAQCVEACPTGALTWAQESKRKPDS